jgi:hypothetical protein
MTTHLPLSRPWLYNKEVNPRLYFEHGILPKLVPELTANEKTWFPRDSLFHTLHKYCKIEWLLNKFEGKVIKPWLWYADQTLSMELWWPFIINSHVSCRTVAVWFYILVFDRVTLHIPLCKKVAIYGAYFIYLFIFIFFFWTLRMFFSSSSFHQSNFFYSLILDKLSGKHGFYSIFNRSK